MIQTMKAEGAKARRWREDIMGLGRPALSERSGYSIQSIVRMELGYDPETLKPVGPRDMQKYKLACAALASGLRFDWGKITISL